MGHGIFVLVQKDSNAKKESFCCTEPYKLFTKFTTRNRKRKKENQSFFIETILCFPELSVRANKLNIKKKFKEGWKGEYSNKTMSF
jgi:hypothetical protein